MQGQHPRSEAVAEHIDKMIQLAKNCKHENTKFVEVDMDITSNGTVLDAETVEVCTEYYCGAIVRSRL